MIHQSTMHATIVFGLSFVVVRFHCHFFSLVLRVCNIHHCNIITASTIWSKKLPLRQKRVSNTRCHRRVGAAQNYLKSLRLVWPRGSRPPSPVILLGFCVDLKQSSLDHSRLLNDKENPTSRVRSGLHCLGTRNVSVVGRAPVRRGTERPFNQGEKSDQNIQRSNDPYR